MKTRILQVFAVLLLSQSLFAGPIDTFYRSIRVAFSYSPAIFPLEWQQSPISGEASIIENGERMRCKLLTIKALDKYPADVLKLNLKSVYWLKKMSFYGVEYGGTNSNSAVYLTNDGANLGYTDNYLEQTFHHEFSSILFRNYPSLFDSIAWKSVNEKSFIYNDPEDGVGAIRNNASSQDLDTAICRRGLLTQYSMSSIENDVNTFAQNLFAASEGFWDLMTKYPRIRMKVYILIRFYNKINPLFTEQYFRRISNN